MPSARGLPLAEKRGETGEWPIWKKGHLHRDSNVYVVYVLSRLPFFPLRVQLCKEFFTTFHFCQTTYCIASSSVQHCSSFVYSRIASYFGCTHKWYLIGHSQYGAVLLGDPGLQRGLFPSYIAKVRLWATWLRQHNWKAINAPRLLYVISDYSKVGTISHLSI